MRWRGGGRGRSIGGKEIFDRPTTQKLTALRRRPVRARRLEGEKAEMAVNNGGSGMT